MKKLIAIAFSDLHLNNWESHNTDKARLKTSVEALERVIKKANLKGVPLLFAGDFIHNPKSMSNWVFDELTQLFSRIQLLSGLYAISGNHDMCEKNNIQWTSPSYVKSFSRVIPGFNCVDRSSIQLKNTLIVGLPYMDNENSFVIALSDLIQEIKHLNHKGHKTLLIHQNLPNAVEPSGYKVEDHLPKQIYKDLKFFNIVLSGHIHKPQQIFENTWMLGATNHQNIGDMGCDMGYWKIYLDAKPKFIKLKLPEFKTYHGDKPKGNHIWIKEEIEKPQTESDAPAFGPTTSRKALAKNFCKSKKIKDKGKVIALIKSLTHEH